MSVAVLLYVVSNVLEERIISLFMAKVNVVHYSGMSVITRLYDMTTHKTKINICTAIRTSNLMHYMELLLKYNFYIL